MRYGVCFKGSKNNIAEWVYSYFPKASNFYDLFAGGCAITQIALMKQEYKNYFCNDIDSDGINLFLNAIHGKYQNERRWISREEFFRLKDSDPYVKYAWSFGNNGRDYLYSKEIEPYKKAWHYAVYFNDFSLAKKIGVDLSNCQYRESIYEKYITSKAILRNFSDDENITRCIDIERQQQLESLNRLQSLQSLQSLHNYSLSFAEVNILPDSVVYCDIPYINTNTYGNKKDNHSFNHDYFYDWCRNQKELVIISEYTMPDDFIVIAETEKKVTLCAGADHTATERLFIPKHQKELYDRLKPRKWVMQEFEF